LLGENRLQHGILQPAKEHAEFVELFRHGV
jgi:hypothetical protein